MNRAKRLYDEDFFVTEDEIFEFYNEMLSETENGALGHATTHHPLLDLNFKVSSLRGRTEEAITEDFVKAFYSDSKYSVKWLFFLRDILEGLGERRTFRICLKYLAVSHPDYARAIMEFVPEYGRYDDWLILLDTPLRKEVSVLIQRQLVADLKSMKEQKPVSLLAKWLPSINTSSAETRRIAKMLADDMKVSPRIYRKTLAELRAYMDVLEVKISDGKWSEVDYEKVPSKAMLKYQLAFLNHDRERHLDYLRQLLVGNSKINIKGLAPHELVHRLLEGQPLDTMWRNSGLRTNPLVEAMWEVMVAQGYKNSWGLEDCIVVADGSGSMSARVSGQSSLTAMEVCYGLAIYFSQMLSGFYKDKAITFSRNPRFIDLSKGKSLKDKLEIMYAYSEIANTNIEAVFDLLLRAAVSNEVPAEYIPKQILIISDMEFDTATATRVSEANETLFKTIERQYHAAGYEMPRLIFWNVCGRTDTIPAVEGDNGVCLLSGFSQNAIKTAVQKEKKDPYVMLLQTLDSPRYDKIEQALTKLKNNDKL